MSFYFFQSYGIIIMKSVMEVFMSYSEAKEKYAAYGVDTEAVLDTLRNISISVHCWQGDDVVGFDSDEALSGGIQTTKMPGGAYGGL